MASTLQKKPLELKTPRIDEFTPRTELSMYTSQSPIYFAYEHGEAVWSTPCLARTDPIMATVNSPQLSQSNANWKFAQFKYKLVHFESMARWNFCGHTDARTLCESRHKHIVCP